MIAEWTPLSNKTFEEAHMITRHSPTGVAPPSSAYTHGVRVSDAKTWMHISGQVGTLADGSLAGGSAEQMEVCWQRIIDILEDVGLYREVRDRMLDGHICASTLLIVSALADPDWTVEIEAVAAK
jgi:2-iminobutanoate/2-iminopropanoate deaminase